MKKILILIGVSGIFKRKGYVRFFTTLFIASVLIVSIAFFRAGFVLSSQDLKSLAEDAYPEELIFTLDNGVATATGVELPFTLLSGEFRSSQNNNSLVINTDISASPQALDQQGGDVAILFASDGILTRNHSGKVSVIAYPDNWSLDLSASNIGSKIDGLAVFIQDHLIKVVFVVGAIASISLFVVLSIRFLIGVLMASLIGYMYTSRFQKKYTFKKIFQAAVVASPTLVLLELIFSFIGFRYFSFFLLLTWILIANISKEKKGLLNT